MYEFKDEYLTGIKMIDDEHRRLFELAEEIYNLKNEEFIPDKYDNIRYILEQLREYTLTHFEHEEEYMESIGYNQIFTQKIQHNELREQINNWNLEDIDENQDGMIDEILKVVTEWLSDHILYLDKKIGGK